MFLIDGLLAILEGGDGLLGLRIYYGDFFQFFAAIFSLAIGICAIIQIIIGFVEKLRWSARIIGLYVLFYIAIIMIGTVHNINIFSLLVGLLQILLFFWASKDLSKGHYLN
ncbi:hypothetical protein KKB43_05860 [Patescibacteria group bacterium]|nr:hypothetical protein [Patescibacteria group bacterium]MBU4580509.1 hypothetical protein [Patescibacteria group bacterium]